MNATIVRDIFASLLKKPLVIFYIVMGAHVVLRDRGRIYESCKDMTPTKCSSHHSIKNTYRMRVSDQSPNAILIGLYRYKNTVSTWLQLERSMFEINIRSIGINILHSWHYLRYKIERQQIGPCGKTKLRDKYPIVVKKFKRSKIPAWLTGETVSEMLCQISDFYGSKSDEDITIFQALVKSHGLC